MDINNHMFETEDTLHSRLGLPPSSLSRLMEKSFPDLLTEIETVQALCHDFVESFLADHLKQSESAFEKDRSFLDETLLCKLNEYGFFSLWVPRLFGGKGLHPLTMNVFNEIIGSYCLGTANIVGAHYVGLTLVSLSQNFKVLQEIGTAIKMGELTNKPCLVSTAITEPCAGSDKEDYSLLKKSKAGTWAHPQGQGYLLNGSKIFISNATWAQYHVVVTTETPESPERNALLLVIPKNTPGLEVGAPEKKLGQHSCPASMIYFDNCLIKPEWVALSPKVILKQELYQNYSELINDSILALTRSGVAMLSVGSCAASLRLATRYLRSLEEKSPLSQELQTKVGYLASNYLSAKSSSWCASLTSFQEGPFGNLMNPWTHRFFKFAPPWCLQFLVKALSTAPMQSILCASILRKYPLKAHQQILGAASAAKLGGSNLAMENTTLALGILGASSFDPNNPDLFKVIRDSKLLQIYEGTNQLNALHVYKGLHSFQTSLFGDRMESDGHA